MVSTSDSDNNSNNNDSVASFDTKQGRSKGESTQSVAASALGSRQKIASECLTYFNQVQTDIAEPTVYKDLVNAVEELAAGDVDEVDFVCQVLTLLDGKNDDLILGLNRILPAQYKIDMADLQQQTGSAGSKSKDAEEGKKKRRKTKPKVVEATTKAIVACVVSLAEAAKSGCKKCIAELETGQKTRREHSESCPRKQRRRSSSSASSKSSRSSTSSSD